MLGYWLRCKRTASAFIQLRELWLYDRNSDYKAIEQNYERKMATSDNTDVQMEDTTIGVKTDLIKRQAAVFV